MEPRASLDSGQDPNKAQEVQWPPLPPRSLRKSSILVYARRWWRAWGCEAPSVVCCPKGEPWWEWLLLPHVFRPMGPELTYFWFLREESQIQKLEAVAATQPPPTVGAGPEASTQKRRTSGFRAPSRGCVGRSASSPGPGSLGSEGHLGQQGWLLPGRVENNNDK